MNKLIILITVLTLTGGCSLWEKIAATEYWDEVHIDKLAVYDSLELLPKKFAQGQKSMIFMTDSTGVRCYVIIWGDSCDFTPGEMLYVKCKRSHSPNAGAVYWKPYLINKDARLTYVLFDQ